MGQATQTSNLTENFTSCSLCSPVGAIIFSMPCTCVKNGVFIWWVECVGICVVAWGPHLTTHNKMSPIFSYLCEFQVKFIDIDVDTSKIQNSSEIKTGKKVLMSFMLFCKQFLFFSVLTLV